MCHIMKNKRGEPEPSETFLIIENTFEAVQEYTINDDTIYVA